MDRTAAAAFWKYRGGISGKWGRMKEKECGMIGRTKTRRSSWFPGGGREAIRTAALIYSSLNRIIPLYYLRTAFYKLTGNQSLFLIIP